MRQCSCCVCQKRKKECAMRINSDVQPPRMYSTLRCWYMWATISRSQACGGYQKCRTGRCRRGTVCKQNLHTCWGLLRKQLRWNTACMQAKRLEVFCKVLSMKGACLWSLYSKWIDSSALFSLAGTASTQLICLKPNTTTKPLCICLTKCEFRNQSNTAIAETTDSIKFLAAKACVESLKMMQQSSASSRQQFEQRAVINQVAMIATFRYEYLRMAALK